MCFRLVEVGEGELCQDVSERPPHMGGTMSPAMAETEDRNISDIKSSKTRTRFCLKPKPIY